MITSKQFIYLYLDFDGVLHADGEPAIDEYGELCRNPNLFCWLKNLEEILDDFPEVKIIVSSDWRRLFDDETLIKLLRNLGGGVFMALLNALQLIDMQKFFKILYPEKSNIG